MDASSLDELADAQIKQLKLHALKQREAGVTEHVVHAELVSMGLTEMQATYMLAELDGQSRKINEQLSSISLKRKLFGNPFVVLAAIGYGLYTAASIAFLTLSQGTLDPYTGWPEFWTERMVRLQGIVNYGILLGGLTGMIALLLPTEDHRIAKRIAVAPLFLLLVVPFYWILRRLFT